MLIKLHIHLQILINLSKVTDLFDLQENNLNNDLGNYPQQPSIRAPPYPQQPPSYPQQPSSYPQQPPSYPQQSQGHSEFSY
jgi:hypothetical protein